MKLGIRDWRFERRRGEIGVKVRLGREKFRLLHLVRLRYSPWDKGGLVKSCAGAVYLLPDWDDFATTLYVDHSKPPLPSPIGLVRFSVTHMELLMSDAEPDIEKSHGNMLCGKRSGRFANRNH